MANLPESSTWHAGIYQLEPTDPVLGGEDGISNLQAKQLADRTKWLLENGQSAGSPGALLGQTWLDNATEQDITTTNTSFIDIDATNLALQFEAPPSGSILIRLRALAHISVTNGAAFWALRDGETVVTGTEQLVASLASWFSPQYTARVSGLTHQQSYTYKWAHRAFTGTARTGYGGTWGPASMLIFAL